MVSVVILAHNKAPYTRACLRSVLATQPADFEVIVVDNGSTDETPDVLAEIGRDASAKGVPFKPIATGTLLGCCTARNMAVAEASGDEVIFLDNDTAVSYTHLRAHET